MSVRNFSVSFRSAVTRLESLVSVSLRMSAILWMLAFDGRGNGGTAGIGNGCEEL